MKIAVIDQVSNPGGGARVVRALLPAMKKLRENLDITFFGNPHGIKRERLDEIALANGIEIRPLRSTRLVGKDLFHIRGSRHVIKLLQEKCGKVRTFLPLALSGEIHKELERSVKGFDVAFFSWPFHIECPDLPCPMVGTFHDFNYKYYFSSHSSTSWILHSLNRHVPALLSRCTPIVSTQYMLEELRKFYPEHADRAKVIPIAPMSTHVYPTTWDKERIRAQWAIAEDYLLYPTNTCSHKNIGPLLAALAILRRRGHPISLVIAGVGTEGINGMACPEGIELCAQNKNVFGLGYVSNEAIDGLIQHAAVVVNTSLYEANNGPGFDAWAKGVPVAMSNIPPFLEHLDVHDVRAAVFNPRLPEDIADKIETMLVNGQKTRDDAAYSKASMQRFTWERTAEEYLKVFDEVRR